MQEKRQHTHKNVTQDIPWETLIEGKNLASKIIHHHVLFNKNTIAIQSWKPSKSIATTKKSMWTSMNLHILCHASNIHKCSLGQPIKSCPGQLLPFPFYLLTPTTTLVASYIVASPTKSPSGIRVCARSWCAKKWWFEYVVLKCLKELQNLFWLFY